MKSLTTVEKSTLFEENYSHKTVVEYKVRSITFIFSFIKALIVYFNLVP